MSIKYDALEVLCDFYEKRMADYLIDRGGGKPEFDYHELYDDSCGAIGEIYSRSSFPLSPEPFEDCGFVLNYSLGSYPRGEAAIYCGDKPCMVVQTAGRINGAKLKDFATENRRNEYLDQIYGYLISVAGVRLFPLLNRGQTVEQELQSGELSYCCVPGEIKFLDQGIVSEGEYILREYICDNREGTMGLALYEGVILCSIYPKNLPENLK